MAKNCPKHGETIAADCSRCDRKLCLRCEPVDWEGRTYCSNCLKKRTREVARSERWANRWKKVKEWSVWAISIAVLALGYGACEGWERLSLEKLYETELSAAPHFIVTDIAGKKYTLESFRGKVVILDFWASWCDPCIRLIPDLNKLHASYADKGLILLGVNRDKELQTLHDTVKKYDIRYPQVWDFSGGHPSLVDSYRVTGFPTTIIIDKRGRLFKKWGTMDWKMSYFVDFLLTQPMEDSGSPIGRKML